MGKKEGMKRGSHKYHAIPTVYNGVKFSSRKEARYAQQLDLLVKAGVVSHYDVQPSYELQPSYKQGEKTIRDIRYVADFKVFYASGRVEIVDCKGVKTPVYLLKKKLFEYKFPGLRITEV